MKIVPFDINDEKLRQSFISEILPECIGNLAESARPAWGKMTAQHMLEHLIMSFELSMGKFYVPFDAPAKQARVAKMFLYNDRATPHDFKNPLLGEEPPSLMHADFDQAKTEFLETLTQFLAHFRTQPSAVHTHPIFGPMGSEEWQRTHFKHCYHHLLQFGLIKEPDKE